VRLVSGAEILKLEVETGILYRQLRLANSQETKVFEKVLRDFEGFASVGRLYGEFPKPLNGGSSQLSGLWPF